MDPSTIEVVFDQLKRHYGTLPKEVYQVFSQLIEVTLRYRDELVLRGDPPLRVEEVRQAIDALLARLRTTGVRPNLGERATKLLSRYDRLVGHER
jgi:hypothetical protein